MWRLAPQSSSLPSCGSLLLPDSLRFALAMSLQARNGAKMHESDALSDLDDWTDVDAASSRGAEDTDAADSDVDADLGLRSRASSFGGERWEGLIDATVSRAESPMLVRSPLAMNALATEEDLVEDERVQTALAQSMVSTLTASRSSRSSELRLSFPDPISSSREQLVPDAPSSDDTDLLVSDLDRIDVVSVISADDINETTAAPIIEDNTVSPADSIVSLDKPVQSTVVSAHDLSKAIKPAPKSSKPLGVQAWQASTMYVSPFPHVVVPDQPSINSLALLTLALGYIVNAHFQPPTSHTDLALKPVSVVPVNVSVPLLDSSSAPTPTPMKDVMTNSALAIVPEHNVVAVISTKIPSDLVSVECPYSARAAHGTDASSSSLAATSPPSTALSVIGASSSALSVFRPSSSALSIVKPSLSALSLLPRVHSNRKGKARATAGALSTWFASTLHDTLRALALGLRADAAELHHALEELARAVTAAAGSVHRRLSALAHPPADELRGRHRRALANARRLHETSGAWLARAADRLRTRADAMRDNARTSRSDARVARKAGRYVRRLQHATRRAEHNAKRLEDFVGRAFARVL
jgi:hypothetical protein